VALAFAGDALTFYGMARLAQIAEEPHEADERWWDLAAARAPDGARARGDALLRSQVACGPSAS
jgi:hypothetical protein